MSFSCGIFRVLITSVASLAAGDRLDHDDACIVPRGWPTFRMAFFGALTERSQKCSERAKQVSARPATDRGCKKRILLFWTGASTKRTKQTTDSTETRQRIYRGGRRKVGRGRDEEKPQITQICADGRCRVR